MAVAQNLGHALLHNPAWAGMPSDMWPQPTPYQRTMGTATSDAIVSDKIAGWAGTSGDSNLDSIRMQLAAETEFVVKDAAHPWPAATEALAGQELATSPAASYAVGPIAPAEGLANQAFLREMYGQTQADLATRGLDGMYVYRGSQWDEGDPLARASGPFDGATRVGLTVTQPMSSWSINPDTAIAFATADMFNGRLDAMWVPADRILSTPRTGYGCANEGEVVVLGGPYYTTSQAWQSGHQPMSSALFTKKAAGPTSTVRLDDVLANADWPKRTWDIYLPPDVYRARFGPLNPDLPSSAAAPPEYRTAGGAVTRMSTVDLLAAREILTKYNENHDERGRFATSAGSGRNSLPPAEARAFEAKAKATYGVTDDARKAWWLTPDGSLVARTSDVLEPGHMRPDGNVNHYDIGEIVPRTGHGLDAVAYAMNAGFVRIRPTAGLGVEVMHPMTDAQMMTLGRVAREEMDRPDPTNTWPTMGTFTIEVRGRDNANSYHGYDIPYSASTLNNPGASIGGMIHGANEAAKNAGAALKYSPDQPRDAEGRFATGAGSRDLSALTPENQDKINAALDRMAALYPTVAARLGVGTSVFTGEESMTPAYTGRNASAPGRPDIMQFNRSVLGPSADRAARMMLGMPGWGVDSSAGGIATHEFGHAVDYQYFGGRGGEGAPTVSGYAGTNGLERFAEAFTAAQADPTSAAGQWWATKWASRKIEKASPLTFVAQAKKVLAKGYANAYSAGWGNSASDGGNYDGEIDPEALAAVVDPQTDLMGDFLLGLGALFVGGLISDAMINSQLGQYAATLNPMYEQGFAAGVANQGTITSAEWHTEKDREVCELCDGRDGRIWLGDEAHPYPGEGYYGESCEGGPNCRCELWYDLVAVDDPAVLEALTNPDGGDLAAVSTASLLKVRALLKVGPPDEARDDRGEWTAGGSDPVAEHPAAWTRVGKELDGLRNHGRGERGMGNCYPAAYRIATKSDLGLVDPKLCQGTATPRFGPLKGISYSHAWVEAGGMAYDYSSHNRVAMNAEAYRALGRITAVTEFGPAEAMMAAVASGHYGPWEKK